MVADVQQGGMGNIDVASTKQKLEALFEQQCRNSYGTYRGKII